MNFWKQATFILILVSSISSANCQVRILEILKSDSTGFLFDREDPRSLISILGNNEFDFRTMSLQTSLVLEERELLKSDYIKYGEQSDIPIASSTGEDSVRYIYGYEAFVYPPADKHYVDLANLSKILVVSRLNPETRHYDISELVFVKNYPGIDKPVITGSVSFDQFTNGNKHVFFEQLSPRQLKIICAKNQLWNQWKRNSQTYYKDLKLVGYNEIPGLTFNSKLHPNFNFGIFHSLDTNHVEPESGMGRSYTWPFHVSSADNLLSQLQKVYHTTDIGGLEGLTSDYPLKNGFGEDSVRVVNGETEKVYPEPLFIPYWIGIKPLKIYALYNLNYDTSASELARLAFITQEDGKDVIFADYDCTRLSENESYKKALQAIHLPIRQTLLTNWKVQFLDLIDRSSFKEFNDDQELEQLLNTYYDIELLYKW